MQAEGAMGICVLASALWQFQDLTAQGVVRNGKGGLQDGLIRFIDASSFHDVDFGWKEWNGTSLNMKKYR